MPITLVNRAAHRAAVPSAAKQSPMLPTPVDEQANGERSDKRTAPVDQLGNINRRRYCHKFLPPFTVGIAQLPTEQSAEAGRQLSQHGVQD
jgi:hypothetical protein